MKKRTIVEWPLNGPRFLMFNISDFVAFSLREKIADEAF
jgi:hypothetical protein